MAGSSRSSKGSAQNMNWRELDRKMVEYMLWYGAMTIPQIRFLLNKDGLPREIKSLYNRLSFLRQKGLVESFLFYRDTGAALSAIYSLPYGGKTHAKVHLERLLGEDIPLEVWRKATRISRVAKTGMSMPRIQTAYHHEVTVKNFLLSVAASEHGVLEGWDDDLHMEYSYTARKTHKRQKSVLAPDLFFSWRSHAFPEQPFYYFLEVQLSRKPQTQIQDRANKYMRLLLSGHTQKEMGLPYFPTLLFLLPKKEDQTELNRYATVLRKTLVTEEPDLKKWQEVFRCGISYADYFMDNDQDVDPTDAVWYDFAKIKGGDVNTLASLAPNSVRSKLVELKTKGGIQA